MNEQELSVESRHAASSGTSEGSLWSRLSARLGIRVRLQVAFGIVAVMTVIAAAVAVTSFSATERGFQRVATREVPLMTDALTLTMPVAGSDRSWAET